jgi:hypothetical protein
MDGVEAIRVLLSFVKGKGFTLEFLGAQLVQAALSHLGPSHISRALSHKRGRDWIWMWQRIKNGCDDDLQEVT